MNPDPAHIQKLSGLEGYLASKIRGQGHVIQRVCSVLERGELGLQPPDKPLGSFLFLGPTGVGKTELTLECSRYLFGDGSLHRFDMSEFQHLDSVKLFLGDETGMPGRLGKVLESHTRGILLFDEVEKAHRLIWDLFLQMLDAAIKKFRQSSFSPISPPKELGNLLGFPFRVKRPRMNESYPPLANSKRVSDIF